MLYAIWLINADVRKILIVPLASSKYLSALYVAVFHVEAGWT